MSERSIFLAALDIADPAQRAAYLNGACGNDAARRKHIDELLAAEPKLGGFLAHPHAASEMTADLAPVTERPGTMIGPYKLREQIGEGGFGVVYVAEQEKPVRRKVALKIIKPGMDTKDVIARFEAERQALALMDHPNVARVLDAGATDSGRPYFVMELVHGVPITEFCDKNKLPTRDRLLLFADVCRAVQHAHQKGIIHRDLKPTNIMVTLHDGKPVAKVIDFGVSKALSQQLTEKSIYTAYGQMIGTPSYMSPEQAEMSGLGIDTRSDIYSLGVLLYELLTGKTPLDAKRLREGGYGEMMRMIRDEEPPRPSLKISTLGDEATAIAQHRHTDPHQLRRSLRGELDWIVMKCLEKDRARRYETANSLARDVERYLQDEPVEACPPSATYRLRKFAGKHKASLAVATAFLGLLLAGIAVSTWQAVRANLAETVARRAAEAEKRAKEAETTERVRAEANAKAAQTSEAVAEQQRVAAEEQRDAATQAQQLAMQSQKSAVQEKNNALAAREELRRTLYTAQMNLVANAWAGDNIPWMRDLLNSVRPQSGQEDLRGFEWHYWHRLAHSELRTRALDAMRSSSAPVFSADGSRLAASVDFSSTQPFTERKRRIGIWSTSNGQQVGSLELPAPTTTDPDGVTQGTNSAEIWLSPDGQRFAVSIVPRGALSPRAPQDLHVQMFHVGSQTPLFTIQEQGFWAFPYGGVVFSRDGLRLAARVTQTGQGDVPAQDTVKVWDAQSGQQIAAIALPDLAEGADDRQMSERTGVLAINADGSRVAVYKRGAVAIRDVTSQQVVTQVAVTRALRLEFSPDGNRLVGRVAQSTPFSEQPRLTSDIKTWDTASGAELASFSVNGAIATLAFSPDGKWLALLPTSTNAVRSVQLINADTGAAGPQFKGHTSGVVAVAFSVDSSRLFTAADDGVVKEWDIASPARGLAAVRVPPTSFTTSSGRRVTLPSLFAVSSDATTIVTALRPASAALLAQPEEARAATQQIMLRRADDNAVIKTIEMNGPIDRLVSSAGGRRFAAVACSPTGELTEAGQIGVWDTATGQPAMPPLHVPAQERALPSSLWPQTLVAPRSTIRQPPAIALSHDGKYLAYSLLSGTGAGSRTALKIVEVDTQRVVAVGENLPGTVFQWLFSPDGSRLLCREGSASSRKLTVFDAGTARGLWSHSGPNEASVFSADGTLVYAYTTPEARLREQGGAIQIWDAATGQPQAPFPVPFGTTSIGTITIALSPNGKLLASYIADRMGPGASAPEGVQVWDVAKRLLAFTLKGHSAPVTTIAFTPDSRRIATSCGTAAFGAPRAGDGETKLWDAHTGQELLQVAEGTNNLAFTADGRQLLGYHEGRGLTAFQLHRWNASPLAPEREAALLVEAFLSKPSGQALPLKSEALTQIDADASLSESVRAAARQQLRAIRRSASELTQAAWQVVRRPGQTRNDYERALSYLEEALDTDPTNREAWSNRALAHYRLGQPSEALAALERSRELHVAQNLPLPADDLTILAMTQHQSGQPDEARRSLDKAHAAASRNEPAWRNLFTEAETLLAVASQSDAAQRWIGRKVMHRPNAGYDTLPIVVSKAEGNLLFTGSRWIEKSQVVPLENAEAYYTHLLQLEPGNAWAHNLRGLLRGQKGDRDKELEDYNDAIRHSPRGEQGIWAFKSRGQWWERKGNVENAIRDYQEVIRLDPQNLFAFYRRAGLLQRTGKLDEALQDYDQVIRIDPNYAAAYANRGRVWQMKGNLENALKDHDEAIRLYPAYDAAYANRGMIWRDKGNLDNCLKDFDEAIRLNAKVEAYFANRGFAWQRKGDLDRAIHDYDEAIRLNPKNAWTYSERGNAWVQKNEYGKAIGDYNEAIRLDSKSSAWNNKAWLLATCPDENIRDGKQAIEVATQACELTAWKNYVQLDTLAAAHAEAGDFEQALKWQEKVVSMQLPPAERSDSESRLKLYREGKPYRELPKVKPAAD